MPARIQAVMATKSRPKTRMLLTKPDLYLIVSPFKMSLLNEEDFTMGIAD